MRGAKGDRSGAMDFSARDQALVAIYDNDGNDVTPRPLLSVQRPSALRGGGVGLASSTPENSTPTSEVSETATGPRNRKESYRGPASLSGSEGTVTPDRIDGEDGEVLDDAQRAIHDLVPVKVSFERRPGADVAGILNDDEDPLERKVYLTLSETDTFTLLHMPSRCVQAETEESVRVERANQRYEKLVEGAAGSDTLSANEAQTLNLTMKSREVQVTAQQEGHVGCQVTLWDISDSNEHAAMGAESARTDDPDDSRQPTFGEAAPADNFNPTVSRRGSVIAAEEPQEDGTEVSAQASKSFAPLGAIPGLYRALRIVERAVAQNTYNARLLTYRNFRSRGVDTGVESDPQPSLEHLWSFTCDLTAGRNISSMCWNKYKRDLLVVGYGQFAFGAASATSGKAVENGSGNGSASTGSGARNGNGGLVAFWSLKNPQYPEWTFSTASPITALDFSAIHPNLLAVGFYDGSVAIYDVRSPDADPKPVLESIWSSNHNSGKHSDPVWGLHWGDSNSERGETLVSISTDGRVTQWSIKKGLEHTDLMRLKRISHNNTSGGGAKGKNEAFISRRSSGMCLDFSPRDSSMYIAGTEDGTIHKCSCSYAEQYLDSFFGHTGPVYQVAWSPYSPSLFLSCSADWTIRLWSEDQSGALLTLQSGNESVSDIAWLPLNSTVFGAVTGSGKLEVWDVSESILKPQVSHSFASTAGVSLSKLLFSSTAPVVVCGGSDGAVHVLRHRGLDRAQAEAAGAQEAAGPDGIGATSGNSSKREEMARRLDDAVQNSVQQATVAR